MFILSTICDLMYRLGKDEAIVNSTIVDEKDFDRAYKICEEVFFSGLFPNPRMKIIKKENKIQFINVSSITLDGMLLKAGIPVNPRGGGILQVERGNPVRFTDFIEYRISTIDPLEVLAHPDLTSVTEMIKEGSGKILANVREIHLAAREETNNILEKLLNEEFTGIIDVGEPNKDVFGVSVNRDHFGIVIVGETNLPAALQEMGIEVEMKTMCGTMKIKEMEVMNEVRG
ncbi:MAG: NrpR regulatory domain-containing protein [Candidatus Syntropharchaeia archaeon]